MYILFYFQMKEVLDAIIVVAKNQSFKQFLNILFRICTSSATYKENIKNGLKLRHLSGMHYKKLPDGRTYLQYRKSTAILDTKCFFLFFFSCLGIVFRFV